MLEASATTGALLRGDYDPRPQLAAEHAQREALWGRYARASASQRERAQRRLQALLEVEALTSAGTPLMEARQVVAMRKDCSVRALGQWAAMVRNAPRDAWLPLLADQQGGQHAGTAEIPVEAWDLFRADYLRPERPAAQACYERVRRVAERRGWQLPHVKTFLRRLEREVPLQARVLAREGREALGKLYPAQERDHTVFHALQAVNADGHRFDVFVRFPDGTVGRPILVAWQDVAYSKFLAWRVSQTENADLVRLSFADLVRDYGIPEQAWLDNGRSFAAKMITGGVRNRYRFRVNPEDPTGCLVAMGVTVHWATPYHGQAKPIERGFRDFCEYIAKHPAFSGAYTGNSPLAKPETYGSRAVPWDTFVKVLETEIAAHNARPGRRGKALAGRSFDAAFAESYGQALIRRATAEQQRSLLLASVAVPVHADGVHYAGNRYWTEALTEQLGRKVVLRFDPDRLHQPVGVYALDGRFVAEADCLEAQGFADTQAAREHARGKSQFRRAARQMLDAERRMTVASLAAQLPEAPPPAALPQPGVIRGHFDTRKPRPAEDADALAEVLPMTGTDPVRERALSDLMRAAREQGFRREEP